MCISYIYYKQSISIIASLLYVQWISGIVSLLYEQWISILAFLLYEQWIIGSLLYYNKTKLPLQFLYELWLVNKGLFSWPTRRNDVNQRISRPFGNEISIMVCYLVCLNPFFPSFYWSTKQDAIWTIMIVRQFIQKWSGV